MAIIQTVNGNLVHTKSDANKRIRQVETDVIYDEADDAYPCRYTYEETDEYVDRANAGTVSEVIETLKEIYND